MVLQKRKKNTQIDLKLSCHFCFACGSIFTRACNLISASEKSLRGDFLIWKGNENYMYDNNF